MVTLILSVDTEFREGARRVLEIAREKKPGLIILQSRSPSCGVGKVYDGTFTGKLAPGNGVFAQMAIDEGFNVIDVEEWI